MDLNVVAGEGGHQLAGGSDGLGVANAFLAPLSVRNFSAATRRAYAYDLLKFLRFLAVRGLALAEVGPTNLFDCLEWQSESRPWAGSVVVWLADRRGAAPATMNRRIAAVRGLFEYAVLTGAGAENPVPAARRATGIRAPRRGLPGHLGPGRKSSGDQLAASRGGSRNRWKRSDVAAFSADLFTARDRAIALAMLLGGLGCGAPNQAVS